MTSGYWGQVTSDTGWPLDHEKDSLIIIVSIVEYGKPLLANEPVEKASSLQVADQTIRDQFEKVDCVSVWVTNYLSLLE